MFNFITLITIIVGAINWFCIGVFQFDIIAGIFGTQSHFFSRFVYTLIGLAGFWFLFVTLIKHGQLSLLKPKKMKEDKVKVKENNDYINIKENENEYLTQKGKDELNGNLNKDIVNEETISSSTEDSNYINESPTSNTESDIFNENIPKNKKKKIDKRNT